MAYNKRIPFETVDKVKNTHISMKMARYIQISITFGEENVLVSPVHSVAGHR